MQWPQLINKNWDFEVSPPKHLAVKINVKMVTIFLPDFEIIIIKVIAKPSTTIGTYVELVRYSVQIRGEQTKN